MTNAPEIAIYEELKTRLEKIDGTGDYETRLGENIVNTFNRFSNMKDEGLFLDITGSGPPEQRMSTARKEPFDLVLHIKHQTGADEEWYKKVMNGAEDALRALTHDSAGDSDHRPASAHTLKVRKNEYTRLSYGEKYEWWALSLTVKLRRDVS